MARRTPEQAATALPKARVVRRKSSSGAPPQTRLHFLLRAAKAVYAYGDVPLYPPYNALYKEAGEPPTRLCPLLHALKFCSNP